MTIHESRYCHISCEPLTKLLEVRWNAASSDMDDTEFKRDMIAYREAVKERLPKAVLFDMSRLLYTIHPEVQHWIDHEVAKEVMRHVQLGAFIVSSDYIVQISVEQVMDSKTHDTATFQYFASYSEARQWLLSQ